MRLFITFILTLLLLGCKNDTLKAEDNIAYIGGEIINPNSNFVILSDSESVIDTIKLDGRNRFIHKIENLKEGIYTFKHGAEFQIVLLEPNDSILFRLNTIDFDESLVFTGVGAKKNNYLVNDFLENEKIEKKLYKFCQLSPKAYESKIDSLKLSKINKLKGFSKKCKPSNLFKSIAEANNTYSYYFTKEIYPLWHHTSNKQEFLKSLPKDFYDYRETVEYSDNSLKDNFVYNTFLKSSFTNIALQEHFGNCYDSEENAVFKRMSICYNLDRLNLIDSLVDNQYLKDELLYHFTVNYLAKSNNYSYNNKILKSYLSKSKNEKGKKMMTRFANSLDNLKQGSNFPNIKLVDYNNTEYEINTIIKSAMVISFWSQTYYSHFKSSHYKIKELKEKYPEVRFISINIDDYDIEKSKKFLKSNRFSCRDKYLFKNPEMSKEVLAIHPMTKTIIVDKNQKIVNSNTNIFSVKFEEQLLGSINN